MLKKYIVTTTGKKKVITKFYITLFDQTLRFGYDVYGFKESNVMSMIDSIDVSFRNNPESDVIFNKLPLEKLFTKTISQIDAGEIIQKLERTLNSSIEKQYTKVELKGLILYYEIEKIKLLYNFIKNYYDNYDLLKLELKRQTAENKPSLLNLEELEKEKVKKISSEEITSGTFNKLLKLSPNNLITFYILKILLNFETNQNVNFNIDEENKKLTIEISELTSYITFYNDLLILINTTPPDKKIIKNNLLTLIKAINFIFENQEKYKKEEQYLYLNIILLLIYIYGFWLNENKAPSSLYIFVNNILKNTNIISNFKNISFVSIRNIKDQYKKLEIDKINKIAQKYQYLINIDREKYIKSIISEIPKENKKVNLDVDLKDFIVSKGKVIELSNENLPLNYKLIKSSQVDNTIISQAYHDLLILNSSSNIFNPDEIDFRTAKLIDLIVNKIIPKLNKFNEMLKMNPSTIIIYEEFISPFIKFNILSLDEKLFLVYDIVIPYLYDTFKIDKFIDYFH